MAKTEAEVFFCTQADRLADEEVETVAQTLASMNAKACFKTLANIVAVVKQDKLLSLEGQSAGRYTGRDRDADTWLDTD